MPIAETGYYPCWLSNEVGGLHLFFLRSPRDGAKGEKAPFVVAFGGGSSSFCPRRQGIAACSFGGRLDPNWNPAYSGSYGLVWKLHTEGLRLHTGGEFKRVSGVTQNSYARLSPASIKGDDRANTLAGTPDADTIYGYGGADRIDARGGDDTLRLGEGSDEVRAGRGDDYILAVDGSKDDIFCGPGSDRTRATPGDKVAGGVRKSSGLA